MTGSVPTTDEDLLNKKGITQDDIREWVTIPSGSSYLQVSHQMVNDNSSDAFDMSPYVYDITLHLVAAGSDKSFDRHIVITQYPSMFVTSKKSNGVVFVNNYKYRSNQSYVDPQGIHYSWAFNSNGTNQNNRIGSVSSSSDALITQTNNNGYNMIVHPTILDPSMGLILGDSREPEGGPLTNIAGLTKYKPTRTDVTNIVSPGFMIASSYGKTMPISFDRAKERCASYQENGYPAGRWRIPSPGEIEFLVKLSNNGFIPSLFDGEYWAADGRYYNSSDSQFHNADTYTTQAVRCVYDTWFWGEDPYQANATSWLGFKDN